MTRILRLLLIAAIALPLWQHAAAQEVKKLVLPDDYLTSDRYVMTKSNPGSQANLPSIKATNQNGSITICDGTSTDNHFPVYGEHFGFGPSSQMIYPSTMLRTLNKGDKITKLTFYATGNVSSYLNRTVTVRLGETDATTVTSYDGMTANRNACTQVYSAALTRNGNTVTITLSSQYTYHGGNLIVDMVVTSANNGNYNVNTYWYGIEASNASFYRYKTSRNGNYTNVQGGFLPKMTINYTRLIPDERTIVVKGKDFYEGKTYTWKENGTGTEHTSKLDTIATEPDEIIALLKRVYTDPTFPGNKKRGFTSTGGEDHDDVVPYTAVGTLKINNAGDAIIFDDTYGWGITTNPNNAATDPNIIQNYYDYYYRYYYWYMDPKQYEPEEEGLTMLLLELQDNFTPTDVKDEDGNVILPAVTINETGGGYAQLREIFSKTIKSARILTEAMRTGDGLQAGTLFKIDCDKMNKFYLIAKGQLQWLSSIFYDTDGNYDFFTDPCYVYCSNNTRYNGYHDPAIEKYFFLGHMFEQFSPSISSTGEVATGARTDIYRDLTEMKSFGVVHDCPNVPWVSDGHHFMMYGPDSKSADCADVRDMMFFVPDYRMLDWEERGAYSDNVTFQDYFRYHKDIQPKMGLYVIHQEPIVETTAYTDDYYHLTLTWETNLDEFMPGEQQEFDLLEVVYNEKLGRNVYIPVYYTKIADDGKTVVYCDENGNEVNEENKVPVKLKFDQAENKVYTDVFVQREESSREVTYAIQGWDEEDAVTKKHFLSLQMSNQESYVIKGTDPSEIVSLIELSHYSRFNAQKQTNCYSNRFKLMNNIDGMKAANITPGTTKLVFKRKDTSSNEMVQIATATFNASNKLTVVMQNQAPETDFPFGLYSGETTGKYAGYHKNPTNDSGVETWELEYDVDNNGYISFKDATPLVLIDNFTADVSKGTHPGRYMYEAFTEGIKHVEGDAFTGEGHSNMFNVVIYKTNSDINALTKTQVDEDVDGSYPIDDAINFDVEMQLSSKSEILRYDAYRWTVGEDNWGFTIEEVYGEDVEEDYDPTGQADNEGKYYTVRMNSGVTGLETNGTVSVADGSGTGTFVDKYPYTNKTSAEAYTYAPVVESFGRDKFGDERGDYNTYGGPLQEAGNALLDIKYVVPEIVPGKPAVMTDYAWWDNDGKKCAYYTLNLKLKTKEVPANYEIYKVRAWHQVLDMNDNPAPQYLREQFDEELGYRKGDANGKYMFDEFTYPKCQADPSIWSPEDLGSEFDRSIIDQSGNEVNFTKGTFGALKVRTNEPASDNSVIDGFKIKYFVRLYFTRRDNPDLQPSATPNPAPAIQPKDEETGEATTQEAKTFYVVEATDVYEVKSGIPTAIDNLNASEVVGVKYYNVAGIESDRPFQGVNIVVTRYSDGSTTTTKILK